MRFRRRHLLLPLAVLGSMVVAPPLTGTFTPRSTGVYAIRSRLRNTVSKKYSKFSPSVFIDVT
jgi:hypothetical protein